jgi:hypothetical protein
VSKVSSKSERAARWTGQGRIELGSILLQGMHRTHMKLMTFPNSDLTNANRRVDEAHDRLDIQRQRIRALRADRHDTSAAEAVFKMMRRTLETYEEDRLQIEAELMMAKAGSWYGPRGFGQSI